MSFIFYDLTFLIIFCIFLVIFLASRKKKLKREGILILYKTKLGLKIINYIAKKYKDFLNGFEYVLIFFGYLLMLFALYLIFQLAYLFLKFPEFIRVVKIPPIAPLIPYLPQIFKADYLPMFYFTYWIIVLAIAAISHEFLHGIFAKARNVKIKSTGFVFLGPFTGAFVEPDEKHVRKIENRGQIAFLSAGSFANLLVTMLFFLVMWLFFVSFFTPSGVIFNTYTYAIINTSDIEKIGNSSFFIDFDTGLNLTEIEVNETIYYIENSSLEKLNLKKYVFAYEDAPALKAGLVGVIVEFDGKKIKDNYELKEILNKKKPGDNVIIKTIFNNSIKEYKLNLIARAENKTKAYLGIALINTESLSIFGKIRNKIIFFKDPNTYYKPKYAENLIVFLYNLLWWILLVNISVASVNMLPLGIFDGGRVFFLTILAITKSEKIAKKAYKFSTYFILFIFFLLTYLWFVSFFR